MTQCTIPPIDFPLISSPRIRAVEYPQSTLTKLRPPPPQSSKSEVVGVAKSHHIYLVPLPSQCDHQVHPSRIVSSIHRTSNPPLRTMANSPSIIFPALTVLVMSLFPSVLSVSKVFGLGPGPQIVSDQFPSQLAYPLDQQDVACSPFTSLFIDGPIFVSRTARIGAGPEPQFQVYGASLRHTQIEPWLEPVNMTDQIVLADSTAKGKHFCLERT